MRLVKGRTSAGFQPTLMLRSCDAGFPVNIRCQLGKKLQVAHAISANTTSTDVVQLYKTCYNYCKKQLTLLMKSYFLIIWLINKNNSQCVHFQHFQVLATRCHSVLSLHLNASPVCVNISSIIMAINTLQRAGAMWRSHESYVLRTGIWLQPQRLFMLQNKKQFTVEADA